MKTSSIILVTGGSRSGKSAFALKYLEESRSPLFIATAFAGDAEMEARIQRHRQDRPRHWTTIDARTDLVSALSHTNSHDAVLIDCLTLWTSNLLLEESVSTSDELFKRTAEVICAARSVKAPVLFVTNEVGCGIVPDNELSRRFRDFAGWVNQSFAAAADEVWWCVSGIPVQIKGK